MIKLTRALAVAACAGCLQVAIADDRPLPKDPNNVYGTFENGLDYIIRKNANPPERVSFYLHVKAGALHETDKQNGIAHFLEHMCFNGSKNFPPGELIPFMNKMGMQFGAHSNAHTTFHETVYKLTMPDNKPETLDVALKVFGDWSHGLLLDAGEIDKERGVILEESRSGKGAQERIFDQLREQVFAGSKIAVHDVIGDEDQIKGFPRSEFADYWDTWYRPELMTLIVVGDIDPQAIIEQAKPYLGSFAARAPQRKFEGAHIKPVTTERSFVFTDKEQVMGQVQMAALLPPRKPMATYGDYRFNEIENIATWIISRRFEEMVKKGAADFRVAGAGVSTFFNEVTMPTVSAFGKPEDWNNMLDQLIVEVNRALEHKFTTKELELAKKEWLAQVERAVEVESTRNNGYWVGRMSSQVGLGFPMLSAQQELELTKEFVPSITLADVQEVFEKSFKTRAYNYILTLPDQKEGFSAPTTEEVSTAVKAAWAKKVDPITEEKAADGLLASKPTPGKIVSEKTDADLNVTTMTLSNGVIAHHRFMDYKKDQVMVSITFGGGTIEETAKNRGVTGLVSLVNATSRLSSTQISDFMVGKKVDAAVYPGMDTVTVSISGSPEDLETGFELAHAFMTDGKIEQATFDNWKKSQLQQIEQMKVIPQGHLRESMSRVFYGGDIRMSPLTVQQVERLTPAEGEAWVKHIVHSSPIEVAVVGDIKKDAAAALIQTYVGSLPQRSPGMKDLDALRTIKGRDHGPYKDLVKFESITPKAIAYAGYVGCDFKDKDDRRALNMVARIMSDRMIKRIRENEQLVYGIGCSSRPADTIPGTGMIMAGAPTDPEHADRLADTVLVMLRDFALKGPTTEEVDVARKQMANVLETSMKEPSFWLQRLNTLNYRNRSLDELKELPACYESISGEQMQKVAQKYIKDANEIRFVVVPEDKPSDTPQPERSPAESVN